MTTATHKTTYHLFVGVDIAATSAKVSWLAPGAVPTCAFTVEKTPQAFHALEQRLLSLGFPADTILVADGGDRLLLDEPRHSTERYWLCGECHQPSASPPFCQSPAQTRQDRCHRRPNPGTTGKSARPACVDVSTGGLR